MKAPYGAHSLCLAPGRPARTYEWIQRSADPRSNDTNILVGEGERVGQRTVKFLRKNMMVKFKKPKSETEQVVVGQLETARMVEMTRKSGPGIGFVS